MRRMLSLTVDGGIQLLGRQSAIKVDPCLTIRRADHLSRPAQASFQPRAANFRAHQSNRQRGRQCPNVGRLADPLS
jgi:hypothetical protein